MERKLRVSHSAAPLQDRESHAASRAPRQDPEAQDPALQQGLHAIVADIAEAGTGARLVVTTPDGKPRVLVGVRGNRHPWRALALAVLESGDARADVGTTAVPIFGPSGLRGALLLYHEAGASSDITVRLVRAHAARVEAALSRSSAGLAATRSAVDALYQALAAHDERTARHSLTVRLLTHTLGLAMDVPTHTLLEWDWAALLHDVGKIAVPPALLRKPDPLDDAEWAVIRQHPAAGERIVRAIPALRAVSAAVRHHHERWDGGGYPDRLSGRAIPLSARVLTLVDAYETMRTGRPYRAPLAREEVLDELRRGAGVQFDPDLLSMLPVLHDQNIT